MAEVSAAPLLHDIDPYEATSVVVMVGDSMEEVYIDPACGPWVYQLSGRAGFMRLNGVPFESQMYREPWTHQKADALRSQKSWETMTATEQETLVHMAAKKNRKLREWKGDGFVQQQADVVALEAGAPDDVGADGPGEGGGPVPVDEELHGALSAGAEAKEMDGQWPLYCAKYGVLGYPLAAPRLRVFCFHCAGASESIYTGAGTPFMKWAQTAPGIEVCALDYPARNKLIRSPHLVATDTLAPDLLTACWDKLADGVPYVVWSHSVGTWVAFEFLMLARRVGLPMPRAGLFMAFPAPHLPEERRPWHRQRDLDDGMMKEETRNWDRGHFKGPAKLIFDEPHWSEVYMGLTRGDFMLFDEYVFKHSGAPKFDFPIHAWHFSDEHYNKPNMIKMWKAWTRAEFDFRVIPGMGHLSCFHKMDHKQVYFEKVTDVLKKYSNR